MVQNIRPLRDRNVLPPHALHSYFSVAVAHTSHPPAFFSPPSVFTASSEYNFIPLPHSHRNNGTAFFIHCNLRHLLSQTNPISDSHRHKPDAHSLIYIAMPHKTLHVSAKLERTSENTKQESKYASIVTSDKARTTAIHVSNTVCQQETQEYQFVHLTPRH